MPDDRRRKLHCAIYTRKSSDEGLEQDFNSLDAQREACEAYVTSQRQEGWTCLSEHYDDGGISGATLERPALQRLLADIKARKVDVVVVYKVDRLTRALADFAKIVEIFDAHQVSFVSITQQFNTTSSMGRLTLNVLLSFAQFEREVTAERIRDKIAASKKKGMWMGGTVPLGYVARDRTLVINETEAQTVRSLFQLYLALGNVRDLQAEATKRGLRSKTGRTFAYGHLYHLLQNPIYSGRIRHKKVTYEGQHPAIIDQATWDLVQARLANNRIRRRNSSGARNPSPLVGRLFADTGSPFTPTHAVKNGKRYRYYVERKAVRPNGTDASERGRYRRIAATEIEDLVTSANLRLLRAPSELLDALGNTGADAQSTKAITAAGLRLAQEASNDSAKRHNMLRAVVRRVSIAGDTVEVRLGSGSLCELLGLDQTVRPAAEEIHLTVPATLRSRGVELKFVVSDPALRHEPRMDLALVTATVRAHAWLDELMNTKASSLHAIAERESLPDRYVRRLLELAFLAPDVTEAILDGRQPADLMLQDIVPHGTLPLDWSEQRKLLRMQ
jgi:DNA invertase Pin-like site-specific DNA recombinase